MRSRTARGSSHVGGALAPLRRDRRRSDRRGWRSRCHDSSALRCCGRRYRRQVLAIRYPAPTVGLPPSYRFATRRYIAGGDVRSVATILLESARFQGFLQVLTGNMSDQFIRVRCGIFFAQSWRLPGFRARMHFYFPLERPARGRRASDSGRSPSPPTGWAPAPRPRAASSAEVMVLSAVQVTAEGIPLSHKQPERRRWLVGLCVTFRR